MSHSDDGLPEEHEEHVNHEAWVIPYADLLTLLMAMFIALFAMSSVDPDKFKALSIGLNEALGGGKLDTGVFAGAQGNAPLNGSGNGNGDVKGAVVPDGNPPTTEVLQKALTERQDLQVAKAQEAENLREVEEKISEAAEKGGFSGDLELRLQDDGLVVTVLTDEVLFASGSAGLAPDNALLAAVADGLRTVDNAVFINGHTDSIPISTLQFPTNWELSSARATSVARYFEGLGIDRGRLTPVGRADMDPIADNATDAGRARNRRVEIVVKSNVVGKALEAAGLTSDETPPPDAANPNVTPDVNAPIDPVTPGLHD